MDDDFDATRTEINDGAASAPATAHEVFGGYRLLRLLGLGGMGSVYEAEDLASSRIVALKFANEVAAESPQRERLLHEARAAASISHRNCVFVFGTVEYGDRVAIAMELVRGVSMKELVEKDGPLPLSTAVRYALDMLSGLEAAHAKGILHRDVKPANIFLDESIGCAKVGDFGLSMSSSSPETLGSKSFAGTPAYASPEQLQGAALDHRADIYSAGATLFYMLTGRPPFVEQDMIQLVASVAGKPPEPPSRWNSRIPAGIDAAVLKALAKSPAERFQDYDEFRNALVPETAAPLGRRIAAGCIDSFFPAASALLGPSIGVPFNSALHYALGILCELSIHTTLGMIEGKYGYTPGKLLVGLRLRRGVTLAGARLGAKRGLLYALLWNAIVALAVLYGGVTGGWLTPHEKDRVWTASMAIADALGGALLFATARRGNGWAGLHDLWTDTRTTVHRETKKPKPFDTSQSPVLHAAHMLGPYVLPSTELFPGRPVTAWDPKLERAVWILPRLVGSSPMPASRREWNRRGQLWWLNGQRTQTAAWDAFEHPPGGPPSHGMNEGAASVIADILEEAHGAPAQTWTLRHVWITDSRGILCDFPVSDSLPDTIFSSPAPFLRACLAYALPKGTAPPLAIGEVLDALESGQYDIPRAVAALREVEQEREGAVKRPRRLVQLGIANFFEGAHFISMAIISVAIGKADPLPAAVIHVPLFWIVKLLFGAGIVLITGRPLSFLMSGLALTRGDGISASRAQSLLRLAIPMLLLCFLLGFLVIQASQVHSTRDGLAGLAYRWGYAVGRNSWAMALLWIGYLTGLISAVVTPARGISERLVGLWVSRA